MRQGAQGWCTGMTLRDGMGKDGEGGFRIGNTCTPMADKWIRKLWYIYTMEYYSAIKKNTFESILMR